MTRVIAAKSLSEAVAALGDPALKAVAVAGCTDLMVVDHSLRRHHAAVVDLLRIPELRGIAETPEGLWIGAAATFSELREHPQLRRDFPILAEVAATIGALQIQNRATLGGNIANASPAGDSLPVLLALGAKIELSSSSGSRLLDYADFHTGYRRTALGPGDLISRIWIPKPPLGRVQGFRKVGTREAQAISKVVVAFTATLESGRLRDARIGAGSVAATPIRLKAAEAAIEGQTPVIAADKAATAAMAEVQPIDDVRSTAEYRRHVLGSVLRRLILNARV